MMDAALDFQETLFDAQSQGGSTRQRHLRQPDAGRVPIFRLSCQQSKG